MNDYYEIVNQTTYSIEINHVKNIEDCGDEVYTSEELQELMGITINYVAPGIRYLRNKITDKVNQYLTNINSNQKSIIIDDELLEVLIKFDQPVSYFVPHTKRVGNRLSRNNPKPKTVSDKVSFHDWKMFVEQVECMLSRRYDIDLNINRNQTYGRVKVVELFKKMVTWDELYSYAKPLMSTECITTIKNVYDNPQLVQDRKSKSS